MAWAIATEQNNRFAATAPRKMILAALLLASVAAGMPSPAEDAQSAHLLAQRYALSTILASLSFLVCTA